MGIHLAGIVAAVSVFPASLTFLLRHKLPLPCSLALAHISLVGFAVALATTDQFAADSTQLLGKVYAAVERQCLRHFWSTAPAAFHIFTALQTREGQIPHWNLLLLYPYHAGLRTKLWIQRRVSTEPHWTLITDGWSVCVARHQASTLFNSCSSQISHHDVATSASAGSAFKNIPALCYTSKPPVPKPVTPQQEMQDLQAPLS